jgi:uncharacterized protein
MPNPFIQPFDHLPATLPVFPLAGAVVMPGAQLPLNIFETRYLNMVQDALSSHRLIGMIQPATKTGSSLQPLHRTGCAGRISAYQETSDGRIEIVLNGVCRFDTGEELPCTRGYRLIVPDWSRFASDYEFPRFDESRQQRPFFTVLDHYLEAKELEIESSVIHRLPFARLLNVLTTLLPLHRCDKQAIIETVSFDDRYQLLLNQFELGGSGAPSHRRH